MESTTRAKPRILVTGTPTGQEVNSLRTLGEVLFTNNKNDLEHAEVLWVDCATATPDQYVPFLKETLDSGKTLVLIHPGPQAHEALSRILGTRLEKNGVSLVVSRDVRATAPSSYTLTLLDPSPLPVEPVLARDADDSSSTTDAPLESSPPSRLELVAAQPDWGKALRTHQARTSLAVGGPGLIPPPGVMYGIRTYDYGFNVEVRKNDWDATKDKFQTAEVTARSSFYVYRENGKAPADYVVIRVQQATFSPGEMMVRASNVKGAWQYEASISCVPTQSVHLLASSPETTNGPSLITQLSVPLYVRYLRDGGCQPQYWAATHGPVGRVTEGWGLSNRSNMGVGDAKWLHSHLDPWNSVEDPPFEYPRWRLSRFEILPPRVKNLSVLGESAFTVENVAAWRFEASVVAANPFVMFTEILTLRLVLFAAPSVSGGINNGIATGSTGPHLTYLPIINLPEVTEDLTNPCR